MGQKPFKFCNVKPAAMFWGIVNFQAFDHSPRFLRRIFFIQGCRSMGIGIIHYKDYFFSMWIHGINEILYLFRPVKSSPVFPDTDMMRSSKRFDKGKYTTGTIPDIFGICFLIIARTHGQWLPCIA